MMGPMPPPQMAMEAAFAEAHMAPMEAAFMETNPQAVMEEVWTEQAKEAQAQADLAQAANMVEMLRNSGNPKLANSQFVSFIDKVSKGELKFEENRVVDQ